MFLEGVDITLDPTKAVYDSTTKTFSFTPANLALGVNNFRVTANPYPDVDNVNTDPTRDFTVTILNEAPRLVSNQVLEIEIEKYKIWELDVVDAEKDILTAVTISTPSISNTSQYPTVQIIQAAPNPNYSKI